MLSVSELWVYPIKSMAGTALTVASVLDRGFADDRRWMVVDGAGHFMTQRSHPRMARVRPTVDATHLTLEAAGAPPLRLRRDQTWPWEGLAQVWQARCAAVSMGPEAAAWLSRYLETPCTLVYMPEATLRRVEHGAAGPEDLVGFADQFPFLLTQEASLADLNARLAAPVPMARFRPNIVVSGGGAFAEDGWQRLQVGEVRFDVVKPCARCVIIDTDQATGERRHDVLKPLSRYRRRGKGIIF
ncbi:MAG TPA: MOSC N-terminal beta barrel domain-containing protein, partial [Myxococcota bacterium]|nr:MOSC N-terminal beta barrel domain-containing protein [Myxococcota bacterium]